MSTWEKYLQEYSKVADEWLKTEDSIAVRHYNFLSNFLKPENLKQCEWKDFQEMGDYIHSFNVLVILKARALGKPNHPLEHYRKSFLHLVAGKGTQLERIESFYYDKEYKLKFFGKSVVSEIIAHAFPDEFMMRNSRDIYAVEEFFKIDVGYKRGDKFHDKLRKFSDAVKPLVEDYEKLVGRRKTNIPINLEVDQFFSWIQETYPPIGLNEYQKFAQQKRLEGFTFEQIAEMWKKENKEKQGKTYWAIGAGIDARKWDEFKEKGKIAIDFDLQKDITKFKNQNEIVSELRKISEKDSSMVNDSKALWEFAFAMNIGDYVIIKQGFRKILGIGKLQSDYRFEKDLDEFWHVRDIEWFPIEPFEIPEKFKGIAGKTLTNLSVNKNKEFINWIENLVKDNPIPTKNNLQYWWLNCNPRMWDIGGMKIGEKQTYSLYNENGNPRRVKSHFESVKPGDIVLAYVTSPDCEITSICEITKGLYEEEDNSYFEFKKNQDIKNPIHLSALKELPELEQAEPIRNNQGSLFGLSEDEYNIIHLMIDDLNPPPVPPDKIEDYSLEQALEDLFIDADQLDDIIYQLKYQKNIILQGPPGVGKTYMAKKLAYVMMEQKNEDRIQMIQFHQSYSYEDFMQGFRPSDDGNFSLCNGVFYNFCKKAQRDKDNRYFFIIDEINRGNLSKIFGELMMLIEKDKRGKEFELPLTYSQNRLECFSVPENLHLIGTMNTADRSLAMVDYALRRRFAFIMLPPMFDSGKFKKHLTDNKITESLAVKIIGNLEMLNQTISKDKNLGKGFRIGHSYFCPPENMKTDEDTWYAGVIKYEIAPLIKEYWFDDEKKADGQINMLNGVLDS